MAVKQNIHQLCDKCGEIAARAVKEGVWWGGHNCPNQPRVPGPQSFPRLSPWHSVNFVRADGFKLTEWPSSEASTCSTKTNQRQIRENKMCKIEDAVQTLAGKITSETSANEAVALSQAILNLTNAKVSRIRENVK